MTINKAIQQLGTCNMADTKWLDVTNKHKNKFKLGGHCYNAVNLELVASISNGEDDNKRIIVTSGYITINDRTLSYTHKKFISNEELIHFLDNTNFDSWEPEIIGVSNSIVLPKIKK